MKRKWYGLTSAFELDPLALRVFRMLLGALLISDLLMRAFDLSAHYTDAGVLPRAAVAVSFPASRFFLYLWPGGFAGVAAVFGLHLAAALALLLGVRARLAGFVCWLLLTSLHARNPMLTYGADTYLRLLLFWSMFLPLDGRGSPVARGPVRGVAAAAFVIQICQVYLFSGLMKASGGDWTFEGNAIKWIMGFDLMARPLAGQLAAFPVVLALVTPLVKFAEIAAGFALLVPLVSVRMAVLGGLAILHLCILLTLKLGPFSYVSLVALVALVPPRRRVPVKRSQRLRFSQLLLVPLVALVTYWNLHTLAPAKFPVTVALTNIVEQSGLVQSWDTFAPRVSRQSWWVVAEADTPGGKGVALDPSTGSAQAGGRPVPTFFHQSGLRWVNYYVQLRHPDNPQVSRYFVEYLCRLRPDLQHVRLLLKSEPIAAGEGRASKVLIYEGDCAHGV